MKLLDVSQHAYAAPGHSIQGAPENTAKSHGELAPASDQQFQSEEVHRVGSKKVRDDAKVVSNFEMRTSGVTGMLKGVQLRRSHERKMKQAREQQIAANLEAWASSRGLKSPT